MRVQTGHLYGAHRGKGSWSDTLYGKMRSATQWHNIYIYIYIMHTITRQGQDMVAAITIHNFSGYIIYFSGDYFKVWCD